MPLIGLTPFLQRNRRLQLRLRVVSMPLIGLTPFLPWASGTPCLCWFAVCDFPKVFPKGKNWLVFAKFLVFLKFSLVYHKLSFKYNTILIHKQMADIISTICLCTTPLPSNLLFILNIFYSCTQHAHQAEALYNTSL